MIFSDRQTRSVNKALKILFRNSVSITLKHYAGITQVAGENVDQWTDLTFDAVTGKGRSVTSLDGEIRSTAGKRRFIILAQDFPSGTMMSDITKNDKIVYSGTTYDIADIAVVPDISMEITVEGG